MMMSTGVVGPVRRCLALIAVACALLAVVVRAEAQGYAYVAVTEAATARTRAVSANGAVWQCAGNRCTTNQVWDKPSVATCQALAREVGRLRSYGRKGAELSVKQVAQCNRAASGLRLSSTTQQAVRAGSKAGVLVKPSTPTVVTELTAETVAPTRRQGTVRAGGLSWSCRGSRCTAKGQTHLRECFALAREVGRIRTYVGPGGSLRADQLAICNGPMLVRLDVSARSGDDDLRQGSRLTATIAARNGPEVVQPVFGRLASNAYDTARIALTGAAALDALATGASVDGIDRITLTFRSGGGGPLDSPDNWDMRELQIKAVMQDLDGGIRTIALRDDRPRTAVVKRFSDGDTLVIRLGADALR
jgi:hypothetical protein